VKSANPIKPKPGPSQQEEGKKTEEKTKGKRSSFPLRGEKGRKKGAPSWMKGGNAGRRPRGRGRREKSQVNIAKLKLAPSGYRRETLLKQEKSPSEREKQAGGRKKGVQKWGLVGISETKKTGRKKREQTKAIKREKIITWRGEGITRASCTKKCRPGDRS